jgi:alpha-L-fucosidase 2
MYSGIETPFQIDANFGFGGAVLSMLVTDMPTAAGGEEDRKTVVLGPAIPTSWSGGNVKGLRLRGGGIVDFGWDVNGVVKDVKTYGKVEGLTLVNKEGTVLG